MQERTVLLSDNHRLDPIGAKQNIDAYTDIILLDVSAATRFYERHIPGAINIPLPDLSDVKISELPDLDTTIYVYGQTAHTADIAVYNMLELGYTAVYSIGGIDEWLFETISF